MAVRSIKYNEIPSGLKEAMIAPLFEGGDRELPVNYRPVALTSHVAEVIERIMRYEIVHHLENGKWFGSS